MPPNDIQRLFENPDPGDDSFRTQALDANGGVPLLQALIGGVCAPRSCQPWGASSWGSLAAFSDGGLSAQ
jgi:hypothetical protein